MDAGPPWAPAGRLHKGCPHRHYSGPGGCRRGLREWPGGPSAACRRPRPGPGPPARLRSWSRIVTGDGAQSASHPTAVYGSLTCLNTAAVTKTTRPYVTHCEDYRDPANGRTIGIYSFRDLYTTAMAGQRSYLSISSCIYTNDLHICPVCFSRATRIRRLCLISG